MFVSPARRRHQSSLRELQVSLRSFLAAFDLGACAGGMS
jgi:hypothetical protein